MCLCVSEWERESAWKCVCILVAFHMTLKQLLLLWWGSRWRLCFFSAWMWSEWCSSSRSQHWRKNARVKFNYCKWTRLEMSGSVSHWARFQVTKHSFYLGGCNMSAAAVPLRLRLLQTKEEGGGGYQQLIFITQHSSVTVDAKLSPTVNALFCGGSGFPAIALLLDSRRSYVSLWTPDQGTGSLSRADRRFWKSSFSALLAIREKNITCRKQRKPRHPCVKPPRPI